MPDRPDHTPLSRRTLVSVAVVMNLVIIGLALWELIPDKYGLPYDSAVYADMARRVDRYLLRTRLDAYYMQRLFPSAIVGGAARLLGIPITVPYLIAAFRLLDLIAINLTYVFVARALGRYRLSHSAQLAGLLLCFGNFCFLKFALYYPALTDCCSVAVAAALVNAYLAGRPLTILALGVAGAFTHPLLIYVAGALYLYPAGAAQLRRSVDGGEPFRWMPYLVAGMYMLACSLLYCFGYDYIVSRAVLGTAPINMPLYFFSVAAAGAYLFAVARLAVVLRLPQRLFYGLNKKRLLVTLLFFAVIKSLQHWRSTGPGRLDAATYAVNTVLASVTLPAQFLVAHISFFGPLVLLILIFYRSFGRELQRGGTGFVGVVIALLLLGINAESRQYAICLPFVIILLAGALDRTVIRTADIAFLGCTALLISKIWLPINYAPPELMRKVPGLNQRLFLNIGPWMAWQSYLVQAAVFILTGLVLRAWFRSARRIGPLVP